VISFNGELYNFVALRRELEEAGSVFRGQSDTEVMIETISRLGLDPSLKRFNGMFAFALWDRMERTLSLVRDRFGEKPLYYGWIGKTFLFGSELKALRAHPDFRADISRSSIALLLKYNCIAAPHSIYEGIYKLLPGTMVSIKGATHGYAPQPIPYWSAWNTAEYGVVSPFSGSAQDAIDQLETLLLEAVKSRMEADVSLGAFLSGGVDSSAVVALMQAQSGRPVKTFTIGFLEQGYDEAGYARDVAKYLGTDHTEAYVTAEQAMAVIPKLPVLFDEPFSDSSQIPTFLVSELARRHVTVSLSGDGGDELFGGYIRYLWVRGLWGKIRWLPPSFRRMGAHAMTSLSPKAWDSLFGSLGFLLPPKARQQRPGDKVHKLAEILPSESPEALYRGLLSHWKDPATVVLGGAEPPTAVADQERWETLPDLTQRMMYLDSVSYLPDDILVKLDRASMGVSLEARVPFLDHRLFEFAWRLPLSMKIREGRGKWILRQVLYKYVPRELIERPKTGFGIPLDSWLRGPLREWAEELLAEKRLKDDGFFDPRPIRAKWAEHLSGRRNWQYHLWDVLMFQAWLQSQRAST
jgi:asparagine synthase (glutamine-hydrolysing)